MATTCSAQYFFQGTESAASNTVPSAIAGGYHQLFTPSTSGSRPAEIAGATGERKARMTAIAPATVSKTDRYPYGRFRVKTIADHAGQHGRDCEQRGALAQVPRGRVITSCESAPSSGNKT